MPEMDGPDVLAAILGATQRIVELRKGTISARDLERRAREHPRQPGIFRDALTSGAVPRVIAECKRRSPSRGVLRADYDPPAIASAYARHGAAAISVLTEPTFFDGAPAHLEAARRAVALPILRKDFIVDPYQLLEARAWGADAVLLIVAALKQEDLVSLLAESRRLGLDALVEVHDAPELLRAVDAGAETLGINNRNLRTLEVSTRTSEELARLAPDPLVLVAESGLKTGTDLARLSEAGFDAFLIGERFMIAPEPGLALEEVRSWQHA